jgi:hypothetical protein
VLLLMGAFLLVCVLVGPALLTGQPLLIVAGVALGAAVLVVTRRRDPGRAR